MSYQYRYNYRICNDNSEYFDEARVNKKEYLRKYKQSTCEYEKKKLKNMIHSCDRIIDYRIRLRGSIAYSNSKKIPYDDRIYFS